MQANMGSHDLINCDQGTGSILILKENSILPAHKSNNPCVAKLTTQRVEAKRLSIGPPALMNVLVYLSKEPTLFLYLAKVDMRGQIRPRWRWYSHHLSKSFQMQDSAEEQNVTGDFVHRSFFSFRPYFSSSSSKHSERLQNQSQTYSQ